MLPPVRVTRFPHRAEVLRSLSGANLVPAPTNTLAMTDVCHRETQGPQAAAIHHDMSKQFHWCASADIVVRLIWQLVVELRLRCERNTVGIVPVALAMVVALAIFVLLDSDVAASVPHSAHVEQHVSQLAEPECTTQATLNHCSSSIGLPYSFEIEQFVCTTQGDSMERWLAAALRGIHPAWDPPPPRH